MKSAENVQETEALSNAGILDSGPEIGPGVGRRESRDWGRPPSVSRLAPAPHHHSPVRPPISPPDLPIHPGIHLPTRGCLIPDQVISWIEGITEDGTDRLTGDAAQVFTDTVYEALSLPDLPPQLRRKWLRTLCHVCGRRALLPRSLQIPLCYNRLEVPQYEGGCADVWMGDHRGQRVAAKVLRVYLTSDFGKIRRRFCKEAISWGALDHPNVLPLLGVTMDENQFVMVSEWMGNGNINEFIQSHKDVDRFELLKDVARGLIYMHDQGMVHGDLKGANILIDRDGRARIADFGLLAVVSDPKNPTGSSSYTIGGTIRWMSPELLAPDQTGFKNDRPTKQSDCYALGMVIYEVLSGRVPFAPFSRYAAMRMVMDGERPQRPGGAEGAWFTDDLWRMLNRYWATRPEDRPSVSAILEFLERVSGDTKPTPLQADEDLEVDGDSWCLANNFSGEFSWFDPRRFVAPLRRILC